MIDRTEAEEHLRVIRSLMEKATIYRSISAEAAAVGGALALAASFAFGNWIHIGGGQADQAGAISNLAFFGIWVGVLVITGAANLWFLWRDAQRRGEPFVSSGMRMAVQALVPVYVVAGVFTAYLGTGAHFPLVVPLWIIGQGLGLLSTAFFAPRSLRYLGWAFLVVGLLSAWSMIGANAESLLSSSSSASQLISQARLSQILTAQQWMALSFGLLHLIYAVCAWPRRER